MGVAAEPVPQEAVRRVQGGRWFCRTSAPASVSADGKTSMLWANQARTASHYGCVP